MKLKTPMSSPFIHDDFLLETKQAKWLYHEVAETLPIIDYHCHLPPKDVAEDRRFSNLAEIWLEGDHYKWRAMRANGVAETFCTGNAEPYDKFLAFVRTLPYAIRNPLYHWSHLELKRYFEVDVILSPENAKEVWNHVEQKLKSPEFSARGILKKFQVEMVGTTDDPADALVWHEKIKADNLRTKVFPSFRPDAGFLLNDIEAWNKWLEKMSATSGIVIRDFESYLEALDKRHDDFDKMGCRLSDHGLQSAIFEKCSQKEAAVIFDAFRKSGKITPLQSEMFATFVLERIAKRNAQKGWVMQLHIGAIRNNRSFFFKTLGRDCGCDSIGDPSSATKLSKFLDQLDQQDSLPKTILYNLNPADNYIFASMIGNFQDGKTPGKLQYGSGWWFLDQLEGMTWQLNALSTQGLLGRFIGMLTDSRSFMSYPRHEYFRCLLCNLLGQDMARGHLPDAPELFAPVVKGICYENAKNYLSL